MAQNYHKIFSIFYLERFLERRQLFLVHAGVHDEEEDRRHDGHAGDSVLDGGKLRDQLSRLLKRENSSVND